LRNHRHTSPKIPVTSNRYSRPPHRARDGPHARRRGRPYSVEQQRSWPSHGNPRPPGNLGN